MYRDCKNFLHTGEALEIDYVKVEQFVEKVIVNKIPISKMLWWIFNELESDNEKIYGIYYAGRELQNRFNLGQWLVKYSDDI